MWRINLLIPVNIKIACFDFKYLRMVKMMMKTGVKKLQKRPSDVEWVKSVTMPKI